MERDNKKHLIRALKKNIRYDGRKRDEYRPISVEYGLYNNAEGSAKVKIGNTEVVAGIKLELNEPYPDCPDEGTIMVGVELTPLASPEFELGPPRIKSIELARVVDRGIRESHMIDMKKLCIKEGELVWTIIIDIIPLNDEGNLYDASSLAAMAALRDVKLPKVKDGKIDYDAEKTKEGLPLKKEPISITVIKVGDYFIIDPTLKEFELMDSRLTIAVGKDEVIHALQKGEEKTITKEDVKQVIKIGKEKSKELRKKL